MHIKTCRIARYTPYYLAIAQYLFFQLQMYPVHRTMLDLGTDSDRGKGRSEKKSEVSVLKTNTLKQSQGKT